MRTSGAARSADAGPAAWVPLRASRTLDGRVQGRGPAMCDGSCPTGRARRAASVSTCGLLLPAPDRLGGVCLHPRMVAESQGDGRRRRHRARRPGRLAGPPRHGRRSRAWLLLGSPARRSPWSSGRRLADELRRSGTIPELAADHAVATVTGVVIGEPVSRRSRLGRSADPGLRAGACGRDHRPRPDLPRAGPPRARRRRPPLVVARLA